MVLEESTLGNTIFPAPERVTIKLNPDYVLDRLVPAIESAEKKAAQRAEARQANKIKRLEAKIVDLEKQLAVNTDRGGELENLRRLCRDLHGEMTVINVNMQPVKQRTLDRWKEELWKVAE